MINNLTLMISKEDSRDMKMVFELLIQFYNKFSTGDRQQMDSTVDFEGRKYRIKVKEEV